MFQSWFNLHMIQFLLDEHLPGYRLPKRRLNHDIWNIDSVTGNIGVLGFWDLLSHPKTKCVM